MTKEDILEAIKELGKDWTVNRYGGSYVPMEQKVYKVRARCLKCNVVKWMLFNIRENLSKDEIKERMIKELR